MKTATALDQAPILPLKWPSKLLLIRHAESAYNQKKALKADDPWYQLFHRTYDANPGSVLTWLLAMVLQKRWALPQGDADTPLTPKGHHQAVLTGTELSRRKSLPDVMIISPYLRTKQTYNGLIEGWPALAEVKALEDLRLREQRHGLALLYNDWRIFNALHPLQRRLHELEGDYYYVYPQGDSVEDVRERILLWFNTLVREFSGQKVWVVSHHLTILSILANLQRWSPEEFIRHDQQDKPLNCSVTSFIGEPGAGYSGQGRLALQSYNQTYY